MLVELFKNIVTVPHIALELTYYSCLTIALSNYKVYKLRFNKREKNRPNFSLEEVKITSSDDQMKLEMCCM